MRITFLGTGTSQGIPVIGCGCDVCQSADARDKRLRVSVWIEVADKHLVIDASPDFRYQMLRAGVPRVDAVLVTHEHRDHIGGLDDLRPFNFKYEMSIPIYAQPRVCGELRQAYNYIFNSNYPGIPQLDLMPIDEHRPFYLFDNQVEITPIPILHGKLPIVGYRIGNAAYLTDVKTISDDSLAKLQNLDTLIISALHHELHHSHNTLAEALQWVQLIQPRQTYLTHMSHQIGTHAHVSQSLPPNAQLAFDGLQLNINS